MSELITRRTFLKATGAAALVAAAGGMLVGCGDGAYASTPENLVAPPIDNSDFANFGSFTADIGPLSGQWTSSSIYESDTRHNYFYTGFKLDNSKRHQCCHCQHQQLCFQAIPLAALVRYVVLDTKV